MLPSNNNKRIAKNTLLLYFRMLFLMLISLYTSRVILEALGVEDFGIYNVVGGVVTMFSIISRPIAASITRFINYELGKGNIAKLKKIFSTSVLVQLIISAVIIVVVELVGVWFLNYKMNILPERIVAANWVLQFSLLTFAVNLISAPYNAAIIAHEKMSAFAYISIVEAVGKLAISYLIMVSSIDKLIVYAFLMLLFALIIRGIYSRYCKKHFEECDVEWCFDKSLLKEMFGFAGWNFIGTTSAVLRSQGVNIILNLFFSAKVNAARGIAMQVRSAIYGFVGNFQTALNPQITQSYAAGNHDYMMKLMFQGGRLSFYMMLLLCMPVFMNTQYLMELWLKQVPDHTVAFVQLVLIESICETLSGPLITGQLATGNIRNYQIMVGSLQMLIMPVAYIALLLGAIPEATVVVAIIFSQILLAARLYMLRKMIGLKIKMFLKYVYFNVITVSVLSLFVPLILAIYTEANFARLIWLSMTSVVSVAGVEYFVGCNKEERLLVKSYSSKIIKKIHGKKLSD